MAKKLTYKYCLNLLKEEKEEEEKSLQREYRNRKEPLDFLTKEEEEEISRLVKLEWNWSREVRELHEQLKKFKRKNWFNLKERRIWKMWEKGWREGSAIELASHFKTRAKEMVKNNSLGFPKRTFKTEQERIDYVNSLCIDRDPLAKKFEKAKMWNIESWRRKAIDDKVNQRGNRDISKAKMEGTHKKWLLGIQD